MHNAAQQSECYKLQARGFTLLEIAITLGITGLISGGVATAIPQVLDVNAQTSNQVLAIGQLQNAGYWVSHDVQMAQIIDTDDDLDSPETEVLTLSWVGWQRSDQQDNQYIDTYVIKYTYDNNQLSRHLRTKTDKFDDQGDYIETSESQSTILIAQQVAALSISLPSSIELDLNIRASSGEVEEERDYEIMLRPTT